MCKKKCALLKVRFMRQKDTIFDISWWKKLQNEEFIAKNKISSINLGPRGLTFWNLSHKGLAWKARIYVITWYAFWYFMTSSKNFINNSHGVQLLFKISHYMRNNRERDPIRTIFNSDHSWAKTRSCTKFPLNIIKIPTATLNTRMHEQTLDGQTENQRD